MKSNFNINFREIEYKLSDINIDKINYYSSSIYSFNLYLQSISLFFIIYVSIDNSNFSIVEESNVRYFENANDKMPLIFKFTNNIYIAKKIERKLKRNISIEKLNRIDKNKDIAIEKCLLFISFLTSTFFTEDKWKSLHSSILQEIFRINENNNVYLYIIDTLKTENIIEQDDSYCPGYYSKKFKLVDEYLFAGITEYILKTENVQKIHMKGFYKQLAKASENIICRNLFNVYPNIVIPTIDEIKEEAKKLVKEGYKTKKGKILTFRNKHSDNYWSDIDNRVFVEDHIVIFNYLTKNGFILPIVGDDKSGHRIVDSFTLMPSYIRAMCKINGNSIQELDLTALHPNIANKIYSGSGKHISHQDIAKKLNMDVKKIKIGNLSFFNKEIKDMKRSPLFDYYIKEEPEMMKNIIEDKINNGYKSTTYKLFKEEVLLMTEIIKELNSIGIYVLYVYDALYCDEKHYNIVKEIMNKITLKNKINTYVK